MTPMIKNMLLVIILLPSFSFAHCFKEVSIKYGININLLKAIVYTESRFNPDALNCANSNGSCDYGFAQINLTEWKTRLKDFGISTRDLKNPCQNLHFSGWILAKNFESNGRSWNTIGAYNAGFKDKYQQARDEYIKKVKSNLKMIISYTSRPKNL
jgi:soluble lytic murein transglycosylase-like protein